MKKNTRFLANRYKTNDVMDRLTDNAHMRRHMKHYNRYVRFRKRKVN